MFGNKEMGVVTFSYDINELFDDVSMLSAYMAKNIATENGSLMDEFAITDDERDIFKVCLKQAIPNIYESMLKMASGIVNAFDAEVMVEADEGTGLKRKEGTYVEFNINDGGSYNTNVLSLVDTTLRECLKHGTLAEYYSTCFHADLYATSRDKYLTNIRQLNHRLFQLKKKPVTSAY